MSAKKSSMTHNLRSYWNGYRCVICRSAYAEYCRKYYLARAKGESKLVPIRRAQQLLLTFESSCDAARVIPVNQATIHRILTGKVKRIRVETERAILHATGCVECFFEHAERKPNVKARGVAA